MRLPSSAYASRHCGNDPNFVASREVGLDSLAVADVLAVDEHIHEPAKLPRIVAQSLPNPRMGGVEGVKDLRHGRTGHSDFGFSSRESAQRRRDEHGNTRVVLHDVTPTQANVSRDPRARSSDSAIRRRSR